MMTDKVNKVGTFKQHQYPRAVALESANALRSKPQPSVPQYLEKAAAAGKHAVWTCNAPHNVLLLPAGASVGAIGDVMSVDQTDSTTPGQSTISLTVDVVHKPKIVSEFKKHDQQALDDEAHYHFSTPDGVTVDAAKFVALVEKQGEVTKGLSIFAKGANLCNEGDICQVVDPSEFGPCAAASGKYDASCNCVPDVLTTGCTGNTTSGTECTGSCADLPSNGSGGYDCPCSAGCTPGMACRHSAGPCDVAEVCTTAGTCPDDTYHPAGTHCRSASGSCEVDTVCSGSSAACPTTVAVNGKKCPFTPGQDDIFWPLTEVANADSAQHMRHEYDAYDRHEYDDIPREYNGNDDTWPDCWGTCYAGNCVMQKDKPGCCNVNRKEAYPYSGKADIKEAVSPQRAQGVDSRHRSDLYCWKAA